MSIQPQQRSTPKETLSTIVNFIGEHWEWWQEQVTAYKIKTGDKTRLSNWLDAADRAHNFYKIIAQLTDFVSLVESGSIAWIDSDESNLESALLTAARLHIKEMHFPITVTVEKFPSDDLMDSASFDPNERIKAAIGQAQNAFWGKFDFYFPEIRTSHFPEEMSCAFDLACLESVNCWVYENFPEQIHLEDIKTAVLNAGYKILKTQSGYFFEVALETTSEEDDDTYGSIDAMTEEGAYRAAYADLNMSLKQRKLSRV